MFEQLWSTNNDWTGLILRLTVGLILFPHGAQKLLGWFGGYGFSGTMNYLTQSAKLPWAVGLAVIVVEFFGSLMLIGGAASRFWGLAVIALMVGAVLTSHRQNGFFMNWGGNQKGEGFEYHLLMIGLSLLLLLNGGGKYSIDRLMGQ